jgi:hypothetical protein
MREPGAEPRDPFAGTQFLLDPPGPTRRHVDDDHGEGVLLILSARPGRLPRSRRLFAFYDLRSGERLAELRPEPGARRSAHRLIDAAGTLLGRFELDVRAGRWTCRDADGHVVARAVVHPRAAAWGFARRWCRAVVLHDTLGMVAGVLQRRSPEFDGHDLLDLTADTEGQLDRRIALAAAVLAS